MSYKQSFALVGRVALGSLMLGAACVPPSGETTGSSGSGGATNSPAGTGGAPAASTGGSSGAATGGTPAAATGGTSGGPTGTGGSTGTGGTASPTGTGGSAGDAAGTPATDTGTPSPPSAPAGMADPQSNYTCTHLIGINATQEWYSAGFEQIVDNARWQMVRVHSGFVDLWANPSGDFWNTAATSGCAMNGKSPDRIIFIGLKFEWTDKAQWVQALTSVVKNLKDKYPGVKRIELGSFVRGPGNKPCGSRPAYRSTIHPSQDQAIDEVVATDPVLLRASPKFEVTACSDFSGNPPHFAGGGAKNVAKIVGDYYAGKTSAK
jgi:hypothetical protein